MRIIGNLLWWLFGGLEAAIGYFTGSLALACTIIGIPFAWQHVKLAALALCPIGKTIVPAQLADAAERAAAERGFREGRF